VSNDVNDWNRKIIEEFRSNDGVVGGMFEGAPIVLLHTTGRRSGKERVNPLVALPRDGRLFVFASYGGADHDPDWYLNLVENPQVEVEFGTGRYAATAVVVEGAERDDIYAQQASQRPNFAEYREKTSRVIPVVELRRLSH
jgi:deazaflavin-dependent oxidoreductase (nitroreductase family)